MTNFLSLIVNEKYCTVSIYKGIFHITIKDKSIVKHRKKKLYD